MIDSEICRKDYVGNGVLDTYNFTWKIYLKSDLEVYVSGALQVVDVNYTIPNNDAGELGQNVVFKVGHIPADEAPILIISNLPLTQLTDYLEAGKFPAETHEIGLDRVVKIGQQLTDEVGRAIRFPKTSLNSDFFLPTPEGGKAIAFNAGATGLTLIEPTADLVDSSQYARIDGRANEDLVQQRDIKAYRDIYVNSNYVAGDEDATIDFNAGMATIKLEYLGALGVRHFTLGERLRINKSPTVAGDFDTSDAAWAMRIGQTMDFATWTLGTKYGITGWFEMENKLNDTTPELAALSAFNYSMTANSKAKVFGVDAYVLKQTPCVQANELYGVSAIVCSDVDPGAVYTHGVGVRAFSGDMGDYTGVRQSPAFLAYGDRGWDYGFLYIDLNGTDVLCSINQSGLGYFAQGIEIAGDVGEGYAGRLRLTNGYTGYVDGTGQTAPYGVTGAGAPTFAGWVKFYSGTSTLYFPGYSAIQ